MNVQAEAEEAMAAWYEEHEALAEGHASALYNCEQHGRQGARRSVFIKGTAYDFNASENIELRCGCWLV